MDALNLYAHAIAIEREAVERYSEFAERMDDLGNEAAAEIFATLARVEVEHLGELVARTAGAKLPKLAPHEYAWLDNAAPETAARELVFRLMTPRNALVIALQAERRALAFFEHAAWTTSDPGVRALAREMAAEEREHVALLARMLGDTPEGALDTTLIFAE